MLIVPPLHVIFACDGVLIDSTWIIADCITEALAEIGLTLEPLEVRQRYAELPVSAVAGQAEAETGAPVPEGWAEQLAAEIQTRVKFRGRPVQHVADAVRKIQAKGVRTSVWSPAPPERITVPLGMTGLLYLFNPRLYSAGILERDDACPEILALTARISGIVPNRTVVVDSTVAGVAAAVAAGMTPFAYVGDRSTDAAGLAGAGATLVKDMRELPKALKLG
ncbi:6-phosphogluconate phosphatase [Alphaproteobacteria bacterium SO-S41]|nr:6-phosphogluconate phosphatase [Alphaproteobacteria bacterium SO-S41]